MQLLARSGKAFIEPDILSLPSVPAFIVSVLTKWILFHWLTVSRIWYSAIWGVVETHEITLECQHYHQLVISTVWMIKVRFSINARHFAASYFKHPRYWSEKNKCIMILSFNMLLLQISSYNLELWCSHWPNTTSCLSTTTRSLTVYCECRSLHNQRLLEYRILQD
jgi:hypothetical protein